MQERFYLTVATATHWAGGNNGAGAWLYPGETYEFSGADVDALQRDLPELEHALERVEVHHENSRTAAARAAEKGGS